MKMGANSPGCFFVVFMVLALALPACTDRNQGTASFGSSTTVVFKHGKIAGDPALFREILDSFERSNPGIKVKDETLPASTDEQHQFYVINLEGKSSDFDVLSMDVVWVPEFARAGWLKDLNHLLPAGEKEDFFRGPTEADTHEERMFAVPWYVDAGVLYYRNDLLNEYGLTIPETWEDLVKTAQYVTPKEKGLYGFIWQGKQYEGLVCNVLEYFWSNGGEVLEGGRPVIDSPRNAMALGFMRDLIARYKVTPPLVTTAVEETTRHIFGNGRALYMRNWPYAWNIFEQAGSTVKGKVGVASLPFFPGGKSASTLGGWQLGVNRFSGNSEGAEKLVRFLASKKVQKSLALSIGYKPARKSLYRDPELIEKQPFITSLYGILVGARPRPVSPYYMMMTQVMQPEFSAVIAGIKTPEQALKSAQRQMEHIVGVKR